jgi:hypothetical protein
MGDVEDYNPFKYALPGDTFRTTVNGIDFQSLKLDDGSYAVRGGDWMTIGCPNEWSVMNAILERLEELQKGP